MSSIVLSQQNAERQGEFVLDNIKDTDDDDDDVVDMMRAEVKNAVILANSGCAVLARHSPLSDLTDRTRLRITVVWVVTAIIAR